VREREPRAKFRERDFPADGPINFGSLRGHVCDGEAGIRLAHDLMHAFDIAQRIGDGAQRVVTRSEKTGCAANTSSDPLFQATEPHVRRHANDFRDLAFRPQRNAPAQRILVPK